MATVQDVLRIAAGEIGYSRWDDPQTGTKYGRWYAQSHGSYYGQNGVPYCAMFVSWVFAQAGQSMPGLPTASCSIIVANNRGTSRAVSVRSAQPGDVILFDWDPAGGNGADHVGIVEKNCGSYVQTIEGNTSSGNSGSQSNGGGVWRRTRAWSTVYAVYRPVYNTTVTKKNMNDAGISDIPTQAYTGSEVKPALSSSAGATFNTTYANNINVGYGSAIATGTGDWEGNVTKQFKILPYSLVKYVDVDPTAWYVDKLDKAVSAGYMNGYDDTHIGPNDTLIRGQACCLFANAEGVNLGSAFSDVVASPYYYDSIQWAEKMGIVHGDGGVFRPDDPCTRCEFVNMLYNLAGNPEPVGEPAGYQDWNATPEWAKNAMAWAVEQGIVSGDVGMLRPNDVCIRAEAAAMLVSFYES